MGIVKPAGVGGGGGVAQTFSAQGGAQVTSLSKTQAHWFRGTLSL